MTKTDAGPNHHVLASNRRQFLGRMGGAALGTAAALGLALPPPNAFAGDTSGLTDVDILNFALNLEYLEAEFYLRAAFGRGLGENDITGQGFLGDVAGGTPVSFKKRAFRKYAEEIAADEEAHVKFLRAALGDAAVARPAIDLADSFTAAARAAGLIEPDETFDPFADEVSFLLAAFIFEDVGVTAYKGSARLISNKDFVEAAAGILAVEAYHAGEIRTLLYSLRAFDPVEKISNLRDAADGPDDLDQGIGDRRTANIVPADENAIAFSRTAEQVLNIVYLGGESANFGFFPQRLNGVIS